MAMPSLHPACAAFPTLADDELKKLAEDIEKNGLIDAITMLDGAILDGRNRWLACEIAGIEPRTAAYDGNDPIRFAIAKNVRRRHLPLLDRALIAESLATLARGGDRKSGIKLTHASLIQEEAAESMGVSVQSLEDARAVKNSPRVMEMIRDKSVSLRAGAHAVRGHAAAMLATMSRADIAKFGREKNKPPRDPEAPPKAPKTPKETYVNPYYRPDMAGIGPSLTPEERGEPPAHLIDSQHPDEPKGVTYRDVHTRTHGRVILMPVAEKARRDLQLRFDIAWGNISALINDKLDFGKLSEVGKDAAAIRRRFARDLPKAKERILEYCAAFEGHDSG